MPSASKSVLILLGLGVLGANAVVGCSSTTGAGFDDIEDSGLGPALPETGSPAPMTDSSTPPVQGDAMLGGDTSLPPIDSGTDAKTTDGSTPDADAEAGPPDAALPDAGAPGTTCPTKDLVGTQPCGLCGFQTRLCGANDPSDLMAPLVWQPWGFCQSEVVGGCVPGTATTDSCGLCGTRQKVCQIDCQYAVGACKNEPPNACSPGTIDFQAGLSCGAGGRSRTCASTCQYGAFGECVILGDPTLVVSGTVGVKVSGEFKLPADKKIPRLSGTCPSGSVNNTTTSYQYVFIENPTASTVVVSVYSSLSSHAGAVDIDTVVASYDSTTLPTTDTARKACLKGVNDSCSDPDADACNASWGGLFGGNALTLAPNSKKFVYVGAWFADDDGDYKLIARTESVAP